MVGVLVDEQFQSSLNIEVMLLHGQLSVPVMTGTRQTMIRGSYLAKMLARIKFSIGNMKFCTNLVSHFAGLEVNAPIHREVQDETTFIIYTGTKGTLVRRLQWTTRVAHRGST